METASEISEDEYAVLYVIGILGMASTREITMYAGLHRDRVVKAIDRLVERGRLQEDDVPGVWTAAHP